MRARLPIFLVLGSVFLLLDCAATGPELARGVTPVVQTESGPVRGVAYVGGTRGFFGIPFAAPPVGPDRFRPPRAPKAWSEPFDASRFGLVCPQTTNPFDSENAAEDCLRLNVWTPAPERAGAAPVMVFLHGGAFVFGSGSTELYGGDALAAAGVVVVTLNYRLGVFGFLAHPSLTAEDSHHSSGNYGLMDQQRALEWVRDNISRFGGDPHNVTLFGESAGAISACLQTLSPLAEGLFHKVIAESGTCELVRTPLHDPGTVAEDSAEEYGARFAREVGCASEPVAACLRAKTSDELLAAQRRMTKGTPVDLLQPRASFAPNIDGYVIPAPPRALLAEGKHAHVPMMLGTNGEEGTLFTRYLSVKLDTPAQYERAVRGDSGQRPEALLSAFPVTAFASPRDAYNHVVRDGIFLCPARRVARAFSHDGDPVYLYQFTYNYQIRGVISWFLPSGSIHSAELPFVFGARRGALTVNSPEERTLSAEMIGYWTRFARSGDPNGLNQHRWPRYDPEGEPHLILDSKLSTGDHLEKSRCDALDALGL